MMNAYRRWAGVCPAVVLLALGASCDVPTLGPGDSLTIALEPSRLRPSAANTPVAAQDVASEDDCLTRGGAVVQVFGVGSNGRESAERHVSLYLKPANAGTLAAFRGSNTDDEQLSTGAIALVLDDHGSASACYFPGSVPGTATINARSGVVTASEEIEIGALALVPGSSMAIALSSMLTGGTTTSSSTCGVPATPCWPGIGRSVLVTVRAIAPSDGSAVPDDARVTLIAEGGRLTTVADSCANATRARAELTFVGGSAEARWCFGDDGVEGKLTAVSGAIVSDRTLAVPALARAVRLSRSRTLVSSGETANLQAAVGDCARRPVDGQQVFITADRGEVTFDPDAASTSALGIVHFPFVAPTVTSTIHVRVTAFLSLIPEISCSTELVVTP